MNKEYKLPEVLKELLEKKNMSQNQLARELNLSGEAVHKWINFKCTPSIFSLMAMVEIFDISLDYLVFGEQK